MILPKKDDTHILAVTQKVKDIKLPRTPALEAEMARLYRGLRKRLYIPGQKVPGNIKPTQINDGVFCADIDGKEFSSDLDITVHVKFPLALQDYKGPMQLEDIFSKAKGVRVDDGGNVQNMIINLLGILADEDVRKFLQTCGCEVKVTIASSSDPFTKVRSPYAEQFRKLSSWFHLVDLPDRVAVQAPWKDAGGSGTLAITSEPKKTEEALLSLKDRDEQFREVCQRTSCFVSSDPLYGCLPKIAQPPYTYFINASSAFRTEVATASYNQASILPMNNEEAADVSSVLLQRKFGEEIHNIRRPPFQSPFLPNAKDIDDATFKELDRSLDMLRTYIPLRRYHNRMGIACPITFGKNGGIIIGTGPEEVVCFASTPHPDGERALLSEFGDPALVRQDELYEVGAGDASAAIVLLFNVVDPSLFLHPFLNGRESGNTLLLELAGTVFVNVLSRIAGNFTVRNIETNWLNIKINSVKKLFDTVAQESLQGARHIMGRFQSGPVQYEIQRWGIQVLVWRLRSIAYP